MSKRYRVCLVDDEVFLGKALKGPLQHLGFDLAFAPGAAAGFDMACRESVDAFVTDYHMPGFGGARLVPSLREQWPTAPIVLISGAGVINGEPLAAIARQLGADAALVKPFRAAELASVLHALLKACAE